MTTDTNPAYAIDYDQPSRVWAINDIYDPAVPRSTPQYVPNVNDLIYDFTQGWFRVTAVDYTTGISTRVIWTPPKAPDTDDTVDVLLGAGPGTIADSYRAFISTAVTPFSLALDRRLRFYGTTVTSIKIFLGTDISDAGQVVSKFYDQSGNLLGENIPLELVQMAEGANLAIKAPKVGYTTTNIADGEVLRVVAYDDVGNVVSTALVIAQNTTFVRAADAAAKYITTISLVSPFLSTSDTDTVEYPINMPVESLNLMGEVTYSDGSEALIPVDGTKFSVFGLGQYIATQVGQRVPLVLSYALAEGEYTYNGVPSINSRMTREYSAKTSPIDGAYTVKLFVFPVWQSAQSGYRLQFFLYNLDRQDVYDVTNLVEAGSTNQPFNPTLYNTVQNLTFALKMDLVDPAYSPFRFVQSLQITLLRPGNDQTGDNWTVAYDPGQTPPYGTGLQAKASFINVGNWKLDLTCGVTTTVDDWLAKVYAPAHPLVNTQSEAAAPVPNIMAVIINNTRYEFPIAQWSTLLTVSTTMTEGSVVYIQWIKRDNDNDLQLGVSGLIVHLQQTPQS